MWKELSLKNSLGLCKTPKKPYTDAEVVKERKGEIADILAEEEQKDEVTD